MKVSFYLSLVASVLATYTARAAITRRTHCVPNQWKRFYYRIRIHSSLGYVSPEVFGAGMY